MTSPYWGNLEPPAIVRQRSQKQSQNTAESRDVSQNGNRPQTMELPPQQSRPPNRASLQSQASTQSPFVSPTASSFRGDGLAPRPPTLPYGTTEGYNTDYLEKRRRRANRDPDHYHKEQEAALAPPAVPEPPQQAPHIDLRKSQANGKLPAGAGVPLKSGSGRRPSFTVNTAQAESGRPYQDRISGADGPDQFSSRRLSETTPGSHEPAGTSRNESLVDPEAQRRRKWAPDKSPLQHLESTLISKEEKRARVQQAEKLAREKQAGGGREQGRQNSVRFRNRPIVKGSDGNGRPTTQTMEGQIPTRNDSTGRRDNTPREVSAELQGNTAPYKGHPGTSGGAYESETYAQQRGATRRELPMIPTKTVAVGGAALGASKQTSSNKLKKEPPGDPWYNRRTEAEKKYPSINQRNSSIAQPQQSVRTAGQAAQVPLLPPKEALRQPEIAQHNSRANRVSFGHLERDAANPTVDPPTQWDPSKKVAHWAGQPPANITQNRSSVLSQQQQLYADRLDRSEELGPVQAGASASTRIRTTNGIQYAVAQDVAEGNYGQDRAALGADGHHHFQNILHGHSRKSQYQPGDGIYAPSERLNEWRKGGVARLSGDLLDLSTRIAKPTEADTDKAWWEARNKGRRRSSTTTTERDASAYDGSHDTRGMVYSEPPRFPSSESQIMPITRSATWHGQREEVVPRARQIIGYQGTSKSEAKVRRRNKSWLITKSPPSLPGTTSHSSYDPFTSSFIPYQVDCASSSHNIFHPFHTSHGINGRLTATVRTIRVRDIIGPTEFKPPLFLKCGPLLRYCGIESRSTPQRPGNSRSIQSREIWRGSIMIATADRQSVYEPAPKLRVFSQPMDLLPPPPAHVKVEELAPEYVDPIAGLPKIGRSGNTLYVRPVEELEEERDISKDEGDEGLFESSKSSPTRVSPQSTRSDGEKLGKFVEVSGVRLHRERGLTFWRFSVEIELTPQQQRIAYRINQGPATGFWIPARGQSMNIMFHSCNGFSLSVNPDQFSGPDPMWRDVLNTHQTQPFHVMIGGGDQIYMDVVMKDTQQFEEWLAIKNPLQKHNAPFTQSMQDELEEFYLNRYAMWFSQGLFGLANSQIPMVNIFDDHDIIDGFGSYPQHFMDSPVFAGLGEVAFKYYMLFQHQSIIDENEDTEPSWLLGEQPGPYIKELSRSVFMSMGGGIRFLGLDCRTERTREEIVSLETLDKVFDRLHTEIRKGETKHLIVLLGVPIAYPRLVWLENILTSRLMDPVKAMSKAGIFSKLINQFDGGVEILDDLDDHWTAKNHKRERLHFIQDLQDVAAEKSVRITILGGDVHLAAIGQFYSNPKHGLPKDRDFRYMPNVISSAIVNTPPPDMMADIINKRNKVHHVDADTEEDMIPIFSQDVNGVKRNNKHLLPRRNWCSIREYNPELTPPPSPVNEHSPSPHAKGGLLRRFSSRGPSSRAETGPPPSRGGLMRNFSFTGRRQSMDVERPPRAFQPPQRSLSLSRNVMPGGLFRRSSKRRPDDGGINGYGAESDDDITPDEYTNALPRMRGGAGDPSYFPQNSYNNEPAGMRSTNAHNDARLNQLRNNNSPSAGSAQMASGHPAQMPQNRGTQYESRAIQGEQAQPIRRPFHRTPTDLNAKQKRVFGNHEINLEGGLDICINVEISQKDPAGSTVPYRLLVPALHYNGGLPPLDFERGKSRIGGFGIKRLLSIRSNKPRNDLDGGNDEDMEQEQGNVARTQAYVEDRRDERDSRVKPPITQPRNGIGPKRTGSLKRWIGLGRPEELEDDYGDGIYSDEEAEERNGRGRPPVTQYSQGGNGAVPKRSASLKRWIGIS